VEQAAAAFHARVRGGEFPPVYAEAASAVRAVRSDRDFLGPIRNAMGQVGLPEDLRTERVTVVRFTEGFPYRDEVECPVEGENRGLILSVTDFPEQALLVQSGESRRERFFFSTLWHREDGQWRLAGFFVKPATLMGQGWNTYADLAESERAADHSRNAALLYNVAIDLAVPNGWMDPPELQTLKRKQSRISVDRLPVNTVDLWPAGKDTFRVFHSAYAALPQLAVAFRYETPAALEDTLALRAYSNRLFDYITTQFPEYAEVFTAVVLQAMRSDTGNEMRTIIYPLSRDP
jgi:hypothetical protein